ncbi:hypothetical protein SISNIDRAFT_286801 [Sistotremastrum niveocremeum HHB9708]|uniref:Uncharacterized protein n=1 Tax=Sistotremastrum niveocremeum HHB9708 TaxID=1314777 RepID=A0A164YDV7_9AGAM|nr:hypothetical protein SISNIDRAFT_286801 [Sistotremastrum niveocremeum HHB9708]
MIGEDLSSYHNAMLAVLQAVVRLTCMHLFILAGSASIKGYPSSYHFSTSHRYQRPIVVAMTMRWHCMNEFRYLKIS